MSEHTETFSDETLAKMARAGDRAAFETLCDRYLPAVYNRLRALLPPDTVEDVTQEVFLAAMRGIRRYRAKSSFRTWVAGITRHKVADYYRRRERRPEIVLLNTAACGEEGINEQVDGAVARDDWEERLLVRIVFRRLPDHYQEVLLLRFAEGLAFKNIAKELDVSLEATKSRYRRAVAALAREMETGHDDD